MSKRKAAPVQTQVQTIPDWAVGQAVGHSGYGYGRVTGAPVPTSVGVCYPCSFPTEGQEPITGRFYVGDLFPLSDEELSDATVVPAGSP